MSLKQSMVDNKEHILGSLPTQELKDEFLANLDKVEDPQSVSLEEQVKEAQAPDHISEELYEDVKNNLESTPKMTPMSDEETKAAIAEGLKNVPQAESEDQAE